MHCGQDWSWLLCSVHTERYLHSLRFLGGTQRASGGKWSKTRYVSSLFGPTRLANFNRHGRPHSCECLWSCESGFPYRCRDTFPSPLQRGHRDDSSWTDAETGVGCGTHDASLSVRQYWRIHIRLDLCDFLATSRSSATCALLLNCASGFSFAWIRWPW